MSLRSAALFAGLVPFAFAATAAAADCPAVTVEKDAGRIAVYPGGEAGPNKLDYAYIAVVLSAVAVCREDDNDNILADVTVTYALAPGPLYQGSAQLEVFAAAMRGGSETGGQATKIDSWTPAKDTPVTVTSTATGLVLGDSDAVDSGGVTIAAGFVKTESAP